jgi:hypothetical protein
LTGQDTVFAYAQPAFSGELAFLLWLLIKGAKPPAPRGNA